MLIRKLVLFILVFLLLANSSPICRQKGRKIMERINFILERIVKDYLQKLEKEKADEEFFENILREGGFNLGR